MAERTLAVDCDLRRVHGWDSVLGRVCSKSPDLDQLLKHLDANRASRYTVLYEIASATDYTDDHSAAIRYNKRRWMLWNVATAAMLQSQLDLRGVELLVSPSHAWTRGYTEPQRAEIAKCDASNHDLRECQAMIFFHSTYPKAWMPLPQYLKNL